MARDILIVEDEADIRMLIGGILSDEGYQTRAAGDSASALAAVRTRQPNLVILDVWLEGSEHDGIDLLRIIREEHPLVPVVMISGHGNIETSFPAIRAGAYDFLEQPFQADRMLHVVNRRKQAPPH